MNRPSRALLLLVLGGAVAGWGCALLSGNERPTYEQEQRNSDAQYAEQLQHFDALAAARQQAPDQATLRQLYGLLEKAEMLPSYRLRPMVPLVERQEKLANWGYADSQLWLGRYVDPCIPGEGRKSFRDARDWYGKAAAQNQPQAVAALAQLDNCKVPEQ